MQVIPKYAFRPTLDRVCADAVIERRSYDAKFGMSLDLSALALSSDGTVDRLRGKR